MLIGDLVIGDIFYFGGKKVDKRIGIILSQTKVSRTETHRTILWNDGSIGAQYGGVHRIALFKR
jgi:hypothetical protein